MSPVQEAALIVLGLIGWFGLALCVAVAIGLSIRTADRHEATAEPAEPTTPADGSVVPPVLQPRGSRLDVRL